MKPRPGVPFSWHFGLHGEPCLRKKRLSRMFHNVGYYEHSTDIWTKAGEWKLAPTREYLGHYYGLALFISQDLLIKYALRCKIE